MDRLRLIRSAPAQPATAQPAFCSRFASRAAGSASVSGSISAADAARMADQLSRKSAPRPCPSEPRPANTMDATNTTGRNAACQISENEGFSASVQKPGTEPGCLHAPFSRSVTR